MIIFCTLLIIIIDNKAWSGNFRNVLFSEGWPALRSVFVRGYLQLTLLPTSDMRLSFRGDNGVKENLAVVNRYRAGTSHVDVEEISADGSGRTFLLGLPDERLLYFWCSERSRLLGSELLCKVRARALANRQEREIRNLVDYLFSYFMLLWCAGRWRICSGGGRLCPSWPGYPSNGSIPLQPIFAPTFLVFLSQSKRTMTSHQGLATRPCFPVMKEITPERLCRFPNPRIVAAAAADPCTPWTHPCTITFRGWFRLPCRCLWATPSLAPPSFPPTTAGVHREPLQSRARCPTRCSFRRCFPSFPKVAPGRWTYLCPWSSLPCHLPSRRSSRGWASRSQPSCRTLLSTFPSSKSAPLARDTLSAPARQSLPPCPAPCSHSPIPSPPQRRAPGRLSACSWLRRPPPHLSYATPFLLFSPPSAMPIPVCTYERCTCCLHLPASCQLICLLVRNAGLEPPRRACRWKRWPLLWEQGCDGEPACEQLGRRRGWRHSHRYSGRVG